MGCRFVTISICDETVEDLKIDRHIHTHTHFFLDLVEWLIEAYDCLYTTIYLSI